MSDDTLTGGGDSGGAVASDSGAPSSAATERPTDLDGIFAAAEASVDAPAADPATSDAAPAPAPVPAIEGQPEQAQTEPAPASPGEPPKERWPDILQNARTKEREAVLQEVVQQYGDSLRVVDQLRSDPVGTVVQLMSELQANPQFAQQMASHAARTLRASRNQGAAEPEEPQPDLDAGNGVLLYSAQQQAKREAWLQSKWQREMQDTLAPLQQDVRSRQEREAHEARIRQAREQATQIMTTELSEWRQMPHFTENVAEIKALQAQYYAAGNTSPLAALRRAYGDVVKKAIPKAQQQTEQQMVAQAAQKLRAATANPSATAPAAARKPRNVDEVFDLAIAQVGYGR